MNTGTNLLRHTEEIMLADQGAVSLTPDILKILEETREGAMEELDNVGDYSGESEAYSSGQLKYLSEKRLDEIIALSIKLEKKVQRAGEMIKQTRNLLIQNNEGQTILMHAVVSGNIYLVNLILSHPLSQYLINTQDNNGKTALMLCMESKHQTTSEIIKSLISAGADVEVQDKVRDWTALMHSAYNKRPDFGAILIDAGADETKCDLYGMTAKEIDEEFNKK